VQTQNAYRMTVKGFASRLEPASRVCRARIAIVTIASTISAAPAKTTISASSVQIVFPAPVTEAFAFNRLAHSIVTASATPVLMHGAL